MLEALAVVQPVTNTRIDTGWLAESDARRPAARRDRRDHRGRRPDAAADAPPRRHGARARPRRLGLGAGSGAGLGVVPNSARPLLVRQGWRAVTLRPRDRLDLVWQDLGRTSAHAARSRRAATRSDAVTAGGTMRGLSADARRDLPLAAVAAATTWLTMLSWRGFSDLWGGSSARCILVAIVVAVGRRPAPRGADPAPRRRAGSTSLVDRGLVVWLMLGRLAAPPDLQQPRDLADAHRRRVDERRDLPAARSRRACRASPRC